MVCVKKEMKINAGDRIAQLLLFPYVKCKATPVERTGAFESKGTCVFWKTIVNDLRPKLIIQINGIKIESLVDTEADVSIMSHKY